MRRCLAACTLAMMLLVGCTTGEEPDPAPGAAPEAEDGDEDDQIEDASPTGLRVGVVLPPRDQAAADELEVGALDRDGLPDELRDEVAELRTVVPDTDAFVPDLAGLLVGEGYDLVCVFGARAGDVARALAERHPATEVCAAPAGPDEDEEGDDDGEDAAPGNLLHVQVATAELGHVVGVALGHLGGEEPVALLGTGDRAGGEAFRAGLRAGVGGTPLREARGELETLQGEIDEALADEVAAIAVDAGDQAADLVAGIDGVPVLAPSPLLSEEAPGALRWRVRWEVVLEVVLTHLLEGDVELPADLGVAERAFALDHGPQAGDAVAAVVAQALGELERGERDPLDPPDDDEELEDLALDDVEITGIPVPPE